MSLIPYQLQIWSRKYRDGWGTSFRRSLRFCDRTIDCVYCIAERLDCSTYFLKPLFLFHTWTITLHLHGFPRHLYDGWKPLIAFDFDVSIFIDWCDSRCIQLKSSVFYIQFSMHLFCEFSSFVRLFIAITKGDVSVKEIKAVLLSIELFLTIHWRLWDWQKCELFLFENKWRSFSVYNWCAPSTFGI